MYKAGECEQNIEMPEEAREAERPAAGRETRAGAGGQEAAAGTGWLAADAGEGREAEPASGGFQAGPASGGFQTAPAAEGFQAGPRRREPSVRMQKIRKDTVKIRLIIFGTLAVLLLVGSIFSDYLTPYDPYEQNLSIAKEAPSAEHPFGTDRYGRDMLSRVIVGSKASIYSTLLLVAIITALGTVIGIFCGWHGRWIDTVLMRISDIFLAFPGLVFALAVAGVLGGGLQNAIIALAAISWPKYARIARSQTLSQKEMVYLRAAKLSGSSTAKIIFRHILPNIVGPILVTAMLDIGTMMMELAGLSFLGLGAKPPTAEWGSMISEARSLLTTAPWVTLSPGIAIFISVMIFNLLGDTIRDYADPKFRSN